MIHPLKRIASGILLCSLLIAATVGAQEPSSHCGTALWMAQRERARPHAGISQSPSEARAARLAKQAAGPPVYRTLTTDHFSLHYVLRGINRVKTVAADAPLLHARDSLYALLGDSADAAVYSRLDAMGAAHPAFVTTLADYLEEARGYYVGTLKMRAPVSGSASNYYQAPPDAARIPVDVADVGTAEPDFKTRPIYALTYPAGYGGILFDNDFLYNSKLPANGIPAGDAIVSMVGDKLIHDYSQDWAAGIKVTCFHEFYHAVQFTYTPNPVGFHVWYEASAVGMEERNAPEVNDYLQYVRYLFSALKNESMFEYDPYGLATYGNGLYHMFLTQELGADFDVGVWTRLAANGNDLKAALAAAYAVKGKVSREVYARFGAQLAFSGTTAKMPTTPFSPDIPIWPVFPADSVDLGETAGFVSATLPPMSMQAMKLAHAAASGKSLVLKDTVLSPVFLRLPGDSGSVTYPGLGNVPLSSLGADGPPLMLLLANGTQDRTGSGSIRVNQSRADTAVYAYPNPVNAGAAFGELDFSRVTRAVTVEVFAEDGRLVRSLDFDPATDLWSWDLADGAGSKLKPGLYYYRAGAGTLQALYLR